MRLVTRLAGLVLFAAAFVLLVVDGTRTLAANTLVLTPLGTSWREASAQSFVAARQFVTVHSAPFVWKALSSTLLAWPGFVVAGIPAVLLMTAGWSRRRKRTRLQMP